jgi:hypothetical protein
MVVLPWWCRRRPVITMNLRSAVHRVHERVVSYLIRVVTWRSIGATMCAMTEQEQYDAVAEDYDRLIRPR